MAAPTIVTGILTGGSNNHQTTSEEANAVATDFVSEGVVGTFTNTAGVAPATGAFAVNASGTPDANINISTGVAYVTATPSSQNSQALRINCSVTGTLTISSNSSGSTKYDWIYISVDATNAANPNSAADNVATIVASRSSSASTDDGTPPTYGLPIAVVTVANGFSTITNGNIRDVRTNSIVNLGSSSVSSGWIELGQTPNTVTALGNRSYSMVFNDTNLTTTVSPGMRLRSTRLVSAPTSCFSLDGSNDYYNDTSVTGMSFTDDFVAGAWVYLTSYTGADAVVISRFNNTSGWELKVTPGGLVSAVGYNAGAANFSYVRSYQSVPLNRWVHIAAQLDMSAFTSTSSTSYITIDGVGVPAFVTRGGTNPSALIQAGNLEIGSRNGGTQPFPGYIDQAFVTSAKMTQDNVRSIMSQAWTAALVTTHSVVSAYSGGSVTDINTTNANNLTAQNGATTATRSPFSNNSFGTPTGTTDYAIITKGEFSTNTTLTIQVPEGCTIPTTGGVSAVAYATEKAPYGMPVEKVKWNIGSALRTASSTTSNATYGAFISGGWALIVPIGAWTVGWKAGSVVNGSTTSVYFNISRTTLTGLSESAGNDLSPYAVRALSSAAANYANSAYMTNEESLSSASTFVMYTHGATASASLNGAATPIEIFAEFGLL